MPTPPGGPGPYRREPTPHSGPYRSQETNKDDQQVDFEAALAYARLCRRERAEDIAADLKISRATLYRRVEMLILRIGRPSRSLMQALAHDEYDDLARRTFVRLDGEVSNADYARLVSELRQINTARMALYKEPEAPEPPASEHEDDDWELADE